MIDQSWNVRRRNPYRADLKSIAQIGSRALNAYGTYFIRRKKLWMPTTAAAVGGAAVLAKSVSSSGSRSRSANVINTGAGQGTGGKVRLRRRRKSKKRVTFSKYKRKEIRSIVRAGLRFNKTLVAQWKEAWGTAWVSDINKVRWAMMHSPTASNLLEKCQHAVVATTANGVTSVFTADPSDLTATPGAFQRFYIRITQNYLIKNNDLSPARIIIYKVRCVDDSIQTVLSDLQNRVNQSHLSKDRPVGSTPAASPLIEDMPFQYWSTPNTTDSRYKLIEKYDYVLAAGDEVKVRIVYNHHVNTKETTNADYRRGSQFSVIRLCGVPTHDETTTNHVGLTHAQIDIVSTSKEEVYSYGGPQISKSVWVIPPNPSYFKTITKPVLAGSSIVQTE